jgi:hypothetical protein
MKGTCEHVVGFGFKRGQQVWHTCDKMGKNIVDTPEGDKNVCDIHVKSYGKDE